MLLGIACGVLATENSGLSIFEEYFAETEVTKKKQHEITIHNFPAYVYPSYLQYYFQDIIVPQILGGPANKDDIEVSSIMKTLGPRPLVTIKLEGEVDADEFAEKLKILLTADLSYCNISINEKIKVSQPTIELDTWAPVSVIISNLPPRTTLQHLFYYFYSNVFGLSRVDDPEVYLENGKGYGRLVFKSQAMAEDCIARLQGRAFMGRTAWKIHLALEEQCSVFVDELRDDVNLNDVTRAFSPAGKVVSLEIFTDEFGTPTDSGKVTFINQASARNCIEMFNGAVSPISKRNRAITVCEFEVFQHECVICFEYFDGNDMLCCERVNEESEIHSICNECARQHAQSLITDGHVGQGGAGIPCSTEGCDQVILWAKVKRLVDEKTVKLLEKRLTNVALLNVEGIEFCKSCDYGEIIDVNWTTQKYFQCRNHQCYVSFCRKCKVDRVQHEGYPCSYVDPKNVKERARKKYEEDLSSVAVRICPHCKTQFQKISGCNHMVCATCKVHMCYICRKTNLEPDHFQRSCGIYTSPSSVDAIRMREITREAIANGLVDEVRKQREAEQFRRGCTIS